MTSSRGKIIAALLTLVLVAVAAYGVWYLKAGEGKYMGLSRTMDVGLDDATRTYLDQRIKITEAAIVAAEKSGAKVDLDLYLSVASDAYMLGDLVKSREALESQLNGNALHYTAWNMYGTVLEAMGDYDLARSSYKKAIDLGAKIEDFYRDYIYLLRSQYPDEKELIRDTLLLSVEERGQSSWSMVELGRYYAENRECDKAFDHYKVAVTLAPSNTEIKNELAEARKTCE